MDLRGRPSRMGNRWLPAGFYKETSHMETSLHTYSFHVDAVLAVYCEESDY